MPQNLTDQAIDLMKAQRFADALPLLQREIAEYPKNWSTLYMAGQCCRFLNDIDGAIKHLSRAAEIKSDEPPVFLALGIAFQLNTRWEEAIEAFRRAIEIDPDYELAYNSLALTRKKRGELNEAAHNYDAGAKALARRIVKAMRNDRSNPIVKHRDTGGSLWIEQATYAALYLASLNDSILSIAWPTSEQAEQEERTESHAGLYWVDLPNDKDETVRLFLPNYFNTFRETLRQDRAYSNLVGNRGTVLELLGQHDEANRHFSEADEFQPTSG